MLDIASNRIKKIENISHLTELQEFWVSAVHREKGLWWVGVVNGCFGQLSFGQLLECFSSC